MRAADRSNHGSTLCALLVAIGAVAYAGPGQSETCALSPNHGGLTFPVERMDPDWTCRVQAILGSSTTVTLVGPLRTATSELVYRYLLEYPPVAADLIRRLHLGLYQAEARGPSRFWGDDGEGTKGTVQLLYSDQASRIYYLEGVHESRLLPHVSGKAVVFLRMEARRAETGRDEMDSTLVAYTKLDNSVLSGLVFLLHPLISGIVTSKLQKGVKIVHRLGLTMNEQPERVLLELTTPPILSEDHVAFLSQMLKGQQHMGKGSLEDRSIP